MPSSAARSRSTSCRRMPKRRCRRPRRRPRSSCRRSAGSCWRSSSSPSCSSEAGRILDLLFPVLRSAPRGLRAPRPCPVMKSSRNASPSPASRSEEHTSELQSHHDLVCRLLLEKKKQNNHSYLTKKKKKKIHKKKKKKKKK